MLIGVDETGTTGSVGSSWIELDLVASLPIVSSCVYFHSRQTFVVTGIWGATTPEIWV